MCAPPLAVSDQDRRELVRLSRSGVVSQRVARQARARRRGFESGGLGWLATVAPGRGPARCLSAEREEAIVADTLHVAPPDGAVCWSTRALGARHGVGKDIIPRVWRDRGLRP